MTAFAYLSSCFICSCIILLVSAGCSRRSDYVSPADEFRLSESQVVDLRRKATAGDAEAAFKLYLHYGAGYGDMAGGEYWLRRADALGHKRAQRHLEVGAINDALRAEHAAKRLAAGETNQVNDTAEEPDLDPFKPRPVKHGN